MIRVLGCIFQQHDLRLVVVAADCARWLRHRAFHDRARPRCARPRAHDLAGGSRRRGRLRHLGTHFVAMLAYHAGLPIAFAPGLTILSAAIAMALCAAGFTLALYVSGILGGMMTGIAISAMHYTGMAGGRVAGARPSGTRPMSRPRS
jgi:NO-binding membrane sensor protein with MHYT domain